MRIYVDGTNLIDLTCTAGAAREFAEAALVCLGAGRIDLAKMLLAGEVIDRLREVERGLEPVAQAIEARQSRELAAFLAARRIDRTEARHG